MIVVVVVVVVVAVIIIIIIIHIELIIIIMIKEIKPSACGTPKLSRRVTPIWEGVRPIIFYNSLLYYIIAYIYIYIYILFYNSL